MLPAFIYGQFDALKNYNVKDGLPSSDVYSIIQDSKGYIWISGDMGVSRFDGYTFKNFSTQDGLPDNTIFGIYEDGKGRIWFRSLSGKLAFCKNDSIYTPACNDNITGYYKYMINSAIYVDERDTIWLGSTSNFIIKIAPGWKKKDVSHITMPGKGKYIFCIDKTGMLYGCQPDAYDTLTVYNRSYKKLFSVAYDTLITAYPRYYALHLSNGTYAASLDNLIINFDSKGIIHK
ncbi:MAG: two-component regulator propeller domain-containing protein, partial [Bacteroidia bacterium]